MLLPIVNKNGPLFAVIVSAVLWGIMMPITRYLLLNNISLIFISISRLYIGAFSLFLFVFISKKKISIGFSNSKIYIILPFLLVINFLLMHAGLKYSSSNLATILSNTTPFWILLISFIFLKDKITSQKIISVILSIAGIYIIFAENMSFNINIGNLFSLLASLTFALFIILSQQLLADSSLPDKLEILAKIFLISAIILTPLIFFVKQSALSLQQLSLIVFLGIFQTALAHGLWYFAITKLSSIMISLAFNISIIMSFLLSWLLLGEKLSFYVLAGSIFIIASIFIIQLDVSSITIKKREYIKND